MGFLNQFAIDEGYLSLFIEHRKTKNTPSKHDSWLEGLGVTGFTSSNDDTSAEDVTGVAADNASDSDAIDSGADVADSAADITGGPGDSTLTMDQPIGVLQLISSSPSGSAFNVVVASSAKDPLLFAAFAASGAGASVGTAKISQPGGSTTIQNVTITALSTGPGSNVAMTLQSGSPKRTGPPTLTMDAPIGALPVISFAPADASRTQFDVTVASSAKDSLLLLASATGRSVGTVKLSQAGFTFTLRNTLIPAITFGAPGSNLRMTLQSASPAEFSSDS